MIANRLFRFAGAAAALALSACGPVAPPGPVPPLTTAVAPGSSAPAAIVPEAPPAPAAGPALPARIEDAYRALLAQMVAVDTSHGDETKLLEPIAALYRDVGVPVQILESAPGRGNLVARLKGSGARKPLLLLAHVDVVPVEGQPWTVPPFAETEKDGFLWGRGVNDDKGMAAAIVAVTLELAREHAPLTRDVIVALTAGEETGGRAGARWLTEHHKDLLDAEIALNEGGGASLTDDLDKVKRVELGVSEKVFQTYRLVVHGKGGHSSTPPTRDDPVVTLARALQRVGELRFQARLLPEARAAFDAEAPYAEPRYAAALRRVGATGKLDAADEALLSTDEFFNAQLRTTCVTTMLAGSPQDNVLPTTAEATVNCRILPGETRAQTQAALAKAIGDARVHLEPAADFGDAGSTPFSGEVVEAVKKATAAAFPGAPVVPGMSTGASDSRHLRNIGIHAYGIGPSAFSRPERKAGHGAHGPDERRPVKWIDPMLRYFRDVVRTLVL